MAQVSTGAGGGVASAGVSAVDVLQQMQGIIERQDPDGSGARLFRRLLERDAIEVPIKDGHPQIEQFDQVIRLARVLMAAGIKPGGCTTEAQVTVALLAGIEAGLTIGQICKGVYVVNGVPSLWGDVAWGLVMASGRMVKHREWVEGEGEGEVLTACCMVQRAGKDEVVRRFSLEEARAAALVGKGPWKSYPKRMLQMRARALAMRDEFPDVLLGLAIVEEQRDIDPKDPALFVGGVAVSPADGERAAADPAAEAAAIAEAVRAKRAAAGAPALVVAPAPAAPAAPVAPAPAPAVGEAGDPPGDPGDGPQTSVPGWD